MSLSIGLVVQLSHRLRSHSVYTEIARGLEDSETSPDSMYRFYYFNDTPKHASKLRSRARYRYRFRLCCLNGRQIFIFFAFFPCMSINLIYMIIKKDIQNHKAMFVLRRCRKATIKEISLKDFAEQFCERASGYH